MVGGGYGWGDWGDFLVTVYITTMDRYYYAADVATFLNADPDSILGTLARGHVFALEDLQRNTWSSQIQILQDKLSDFHEGHIAFEYGIPRMGKRADVVLLYKDIIFVIEFKVGASSFDRSAVDQALDYAVDLKNFHEQSHDRVLVPILCATKAPSLPIEDSPFDDGVYNVIKCNVETLAPTITAFSKNIPVGETLDIRQWLASIYKPTPTIIQAAQALYQGHSVDNISRSDASAINLSRTTNALTQIIEYSKQHQRKAICFVTGVPGAGKTLAGLNIANQRHNFDNNEHAVFLSGNGPLVDVLREALARDEVATQKSLGNSYTKKQALAKTSAFIQNIHHFRDDSMATSKPPNEKIVIFDEAQRAWTLEQTSQFMARKKGKQDFNQSEPEYLISVMDRHEDWSVIICLIGGGQEINTGEAGLPEWFRAVGKRYRHWDVFVSGRLTDREYNHGVADIFELLSEDQLNVESDLHLGVSLRSFRSELLASFVKAALDGNTSLAKNICPKLISKYPIFVTRDFDLAKQWLRHNSRGTESIGVLAHSGAYRLRPYGIHVKSQIDPKVWFLNERTDVRSSDFLEEAGTEFDVQGLELDWICLAWSATLRRVDGAWQYKAFKGSKWQSVKNETRQHYLLNAFRVLLTRARQGMIIFIPKGDQADQTRLPEFYDETFEYLKEIGIPELT